MGGQLGGQSATASQLVEQSRERMDTPGHAPTTMDIMDHMILPFARVVPRGVIPTATSNRHAAPPQLRQGHLIFQFTKEVQKNYSARQAHPSLQAAYAITLLLQYLGQR